MNSVEQTSLSTACFEFLLHHVSVCYAVPLEIMVSELNLTSSFLIFRHDLTVQNGTLEELPAGTLELYISVNSRLSGRNGTGNPELSGV